MELEITTLALLASLATRELASISGQYTARRIARWLTVPVFLLFILYLLLVTLRIGEVS